MRRVVGVLLAATLLAPAVAADDPQTGVDRWIDASWKLSFERLDLIRVEGELRVHETPMQGEVRTADEIRSLHDQAHAGGQHDQFHADAESTVASRTEASLEELVPDGEATVHDVHLVHASLDDDEGTDSYHPSVDFQINASVDIVLNPDGSDMPTRKTLRDALRMGATMPLDLDFAADAGRNQSFTLELPDHVRPLGDVATPIPVQIDNWKDDTETTKRFTITVTGADATVYRKQQGHVDVTIDLHDLRIDPLSRSGRVDADIDAQAEIGVAEVPPEMRDDLPDRVRLDAVGADGLRLALEEGYITEGALEEARRQFVNRSQAGLEGAFGPDVAPDVRFDDATVQGGIQGANDADPPIRLVATAQAQRTFDALGGGQALTITSLQQRFPVSAFAPYETTYRIVLPYGLTAGEVHADGARTSRTTVDGRDAVQVDMAGDGDDTEVTMSVGVTLSGLLGASALLLAVFLLVVLLVVVGVGYAVWRVVRGGDRGGREGRGGRQEGRGSEGGGSGG